MQKTMFLSLFSLAAFADRLPAEHSVVCGDDWFQVEANWTEGQTVGKAFFSGDSAEMRASTKTKIIQKNDIITIRFQDQTGGELAVDARGEVTIARQKNAEPMSIHPCTIK